jgi:hypothetical protein
VLPLKPSQLEGSPPYSTANKESAPDDQMRDVNPQLSPVRLPLRDHPPTHQTRVALAPASQQPQLPDLPLSDICGDLEESHGE